MSLAKGFSKVFDNPAVAASSVARMQEKASGKGYTLKEIFKSPFRAAAAVLDGLLAIPEKIFGYAADTAIGLQRVLTEVPTGAAFEATRRFNAVAPKVYGSPSAVIRWLRGGVQKVATMPGDNDFSGASPA